MEENWFNRLCPANDKDEDLFMVKNSKYNQTDRMGFNIEITDC